MLPITICGNAPTDHVPDGEIWCMNNGAMQKPHVDLIVDIHTKDYLLRTGQKKYIDWLASLSIPVYTREEIIPNAIPYPFEDVYKLTSKINHNGKQLKLFTSSTPFVLALAILQKRPKITICGVELIQMQEFRESYLFWIGFAGGRKIELELIGGNVMFDKQNYGEQ